MSSNVDRPSLADLRMRVQKDRYQEIGHWLARRFARPSAVFGTWLAVRLGLSPHQVTLASGLTALAGAVGISTGTRGGFIAGVALLHLAYWLDHVDGQVARYRGLSSLSGVYFDYLLHHFQNMIESFALGVGLTYRLGGFGWCAAGFFMALGRLFLGLHDDCRYKAFFQRLKRERGAYRVVAGSVESPGPAASPPRGWARIPVWIIAKACEPPSVLIVLTVLAVTAPISETCWLWAWPGVLLTYAVFSPVLACARAWKTIASGTVDRDFDRWFQPEVGQVGISGIDQGGRPQ